MKKLQLLCVDNDLVQKTNLQIGDNIISLGVGSERSNGESNKHAATINLSCENVMTITPVSSCYMKSTESSRWQLLKLGVSVPIKPGDICSLVSNKCWFKIVSVSSMMEINEETTGKRKDNGNISCDVPEKKLCSESGEGDNVRSINNISNDVLVNNNNVPTTKSQEVATTEVNLSNNTVATESAESNIQENHTFSSTDENKTSPNVTKQSDISFISEDTESNLLVEADKSNVSANILRNIPNVSANVPADTQNVSADIPVDTPRREKCKYGKKCYRRNPQHKIEYSHPMNPDYDVPDNRKECPYGAQCYRKNLQHKKEYKHTMLKTINRNRKQSSKKTLQTSSNTWSDLEDSLSDSAEESVDESDYVPSSDVENSDDDEYNNESETEWEDETIDD